VAAQARASLTARITAGKYKVMDLVVGDGHAVGRAGSAKSQPVAAGRRGIGNAHRASTQ
jgi:hypothetical protein